MRNYPKELKESIIARMLPPNNVSVPELVHETGIPKDTLYTWRTKVRKGSFPVLKPAPRGLSSEDKFSIVLETAGLNEVELSAYCRRKGLFSNMIEAWYKTCQQANTPLNHKTKSDKSTTIAQKKEIKRLETELTRKEKALAEAAALLILQKKVQSLWRDPEGEKSIIRRG